MEKIENLIVGNVCIYGLLTSFPFQRAKYLALKLNQSLPLRFPYPEIHGLMELEWEERLINWRHLHGPDFWSLKRSVAVFLDGKFIGSDQEFMKILSNGNVYLARIPRRNMLIMKNKFREDYLKRLNSSGLTYCYFDICIDKRFVGTMLFELYSELLPKTCENFITLCIGNRGNFFTYKGSRIHRIVRGGWVQGGDIQFVTGGGGYSVFCDNLEDESYAISHNKKGVLSMANNGRHTNGSQFFITLSCCTWMDTQFVAFGQLIQGLSVLEKIESVKTRDECPLKIIEIKNCGKLDIQGIYDTDLKYAPDLREAELKKKPKKLEKIADQLVRLIMEAVTEKLAMKEHIPDIIHKGDVPSVMDIDLYFSGFYSLAEEVLIDSAKHLRNFKRELFRYLEPTATEVVEVIMYDFLIAALSQVVNLDDVRETTGRQIFQNLIEGIDKEVKKEKKRILAKNFVDQIVKTAETMLNFISRKLNYVRRAPKKVRVFAEQMDNFIESFVLQETFEDDLFHIAERGRSHARKKFGNDPCMSEEILDVNIKKPKIEEPCTKKELKKKKKYLSRNQTQVDICCEGKEDSDCEEELKISDFFSSCIYELKKPKKDVCGRIPILDFIEICRFQLKCIRHQVDVKKTKARVCLEKKINHWMSGVSYTTETDWIRQTIFNEDDVCYSHKEEILYGAMTVGLIEMYYLMENYLKYPKKPVIHTRIIYPDDYSVASTAGGKTQIHSQGYSVSATNSDDLMSVQGSTKRDDQSDSRHQKGKGDGISFDGIKKRKPCTCGDICCDCSSKSDNDDDLNKKGSGAPPTPPPSIAGSYKGSGRNDHGEIDDSGEETDFTKTSKESSCLPSYGQPDVEELLGRVTGESPDRVNVKSFKWMQDYIKEFGCLFKTQFVTEVHNWLEDEVFNSQGFFSKHSLVSRASLLSFSFSLASLIKDENNLKSELKNFIFDLWELYFTEMFKEALLQYPYETSHGGESKKHSTDELVGEGGKETEGKPKTEGDPCTRLLETVTDNFDFDKFCKMAGAMPEDGEPINKILPTSASASVPLGDSEPEKFEEREMQERVISIQEPENQESSSTLLIGEDGTKVEGKGDLPEKTSAFKPPTHKAVDAPEVVEGENENVKRKKSPIVIEEIVESEEEIRPTSPYVLPFWVTFLTEITKRALGIISKVSRLPRRLYFDTESKMSFENKIQEWIEYNKFSAPRTGGRDIRDYIAAHHITMTDLNASARSFLRKKVIFQVIEPSSRKICSEELASEALVETMVRAVDKTQTGEGDDGRRPEIESVLSDMIVTAVKSSSEKFSDSETADFEEKTLETDQIKSETEVDEEVDDPVAE